LRRLQKVGQAHRWAHWSYVPKPHSGEVHLFLAADGGMNLDPKLGWCQLVTGGLQSYVVPGTHGLMVKSPNVEVLAEKLQRALDLSWPIQ
jgi:thioesterase domain-containing protein